MFKEDETQYCKNCYELQEQLDQLKAENDELKKANDCIITTLNVIAGGNKKLRQTLTEIKEIVFPKNQLIITDSPIILKIQEKISEVENEK